MRSVDYMIVRRSGNQVQVMSVYNCADLDEAKEVEKSAVASVSERLEQTFPGMFEPRQLSLWGDNGDTEN